MPQAVTGLSRSGKTVFTTSLIHNLLSAVHNPNRMPLLDVVGERRLVAANLESAGAQTLPRFPYVQNIDTMASGSPDWPERTADISEIGIDVHFTPASTFGKLFSDLRGSAATLTIRIVDYPGEWLLDLPLLEPSYAEWSRATMRGLRKGVRAEIGRDFTAFCADHPPTEIASEQVARQAHDLFCVVLTTARDRHGLNFLQPGRFLCRGNLGDVPYLWFAPLDVAEGRDSFAPHTLGALMAERFGPWAWERPARTSVKRKAEAL